MTIIQRLFITIILFMGLLYMCFGCKAQSLWVPPNSLVHPYNGEVIIMPYYSKPGQFSSLSARLPDHKCVIWLPLNVSLELYETGYIIEVGHCNEGFLIPDPNNSNSGPVRGGNRQWKEVYIDRMYKIMSAPISEGTQIVTKLQALQ